LNELRTEAPRSRRRDDGARAIATA